MPRLRSFVLRCAIALAAVLGAAAVAEAVLRVAGPQWLTDHIEGMGFVEDLDALTPQRGFGEWSGNAFVRFRPGAELTLIDQEFRTHPHIDARGTRVTGSRAGPPRLAFLGDSFTFGYGVEDREAFVSLLCARFGQPCINLGVPGMTLADEIDLLARRHDEIGQPPLYVFCFFAGDDLTDNVQYDRQSHGGPDVRAAARGRITTVNHILGRLRWLRQSRVLTLVKSAAWRVVTPDMASMDALIAAATPANGVFRDEARSSLARHLDRLDRLSRELGFRVAFLMIPDREQVYPNLLQATARHYAVDIATLDVNFPQRTLAELLDAHHMPWVNPLDCLRAAGEGLYFKIDLHLTARGHQELASCAAPDLARIAGTVADGEMSTR